MEKNHATLGERASPEDSVPVIYPSSPEFSMDYPEKERPRAAVRRTYRSTVLTPAERDAYILAKSGKKQVLKRRFGLLSVSGLATATMVTWESVITSLSLGLANGGPAGLFWGVLVCWIGTQATFISMGELASMMPTAGGQYHWASVLAPKSAKKLFGYITGWVVMATWAAGALAGAYASANQMVDLIAFLDTSYTPASYHGAFITWGIIAIGVVFNTVFGALLPAFELGFLVLHILGFFAVLIPLLNLGPKGNIPQIFTQFSNEGGWSSAGLAFLIGLQGNASAFIGGDCSIHMAEETEKAEINVPWSITIAVFINGATAFVMMFVFLYVAGPLDELRDSPLTFPYIQVIYNATGSRGATAALGGLFILTGVGGCTSSISSGSRMVWSFARDKGLPFSKQVAKVDKRFAIPMVAIGVISIAAALVGLIQIGSSAALSIVLSLIVEGFLSSYLIVLLMLLYHRIRGNIVDKDTYEMTLREGIEGRAEPLFAWGPWRLKGLPGILNNALGCTYLVVAAFFSFWPTTVHVEPISMNWSSAVFGAVAILSAIYYFFWARRIFNGPIIEVVVDAENHVRI